MKRGNIRARVWGWDSFGNICGMFRLQALANLSRGSWGVERGFTIVLARATHKTAQVVYYGWDVECKTELGQNIFRRYFLQGFNEWVSLNQKFHKNSQSLFVSEKNFNFCFQFKWRKLWIFTEQEKAPNKRKRNFNFSISHFLFYLRLQFLFFNF